MRPGDGSLITFSLDFKRCWAPCKSGSLASTNSNAELAGLDRVAARDRMHWSSPSIDRLVAQERMHWSLASIDRLVAQERVLWSSAVQYRLILLATALILFAVAPSLAKAEAEYSLTPPSVYHVLLGDLHVNYSIPSDVVMNHAFVRLDYWSRTRNRAIEVQSLGLPRGRSSGTLIFACGVIEIAGSYSFRMFTHRGGTMLTRASLDVRWPEITLSLPTELTALTSSAELRVNSTVTCAAKRGQFNFRIKLYHWRGGKSGAVTSVSRGKPEEMKGGNEEEMELIVPWSKAEQVSEITFPDVEENITKISLGCHLFDLNGWYRAVLVSTSLDAPRVAISNAMTVFWGHGYQLSVMRDSVFPCNAPLEILYSHPPCAGANDRIRFYSRTRTAAGSPASPLDRKYVKEFKADPDAGQMLLQCNMFSQKASGFCITYVSVTRGDVFTEQTERCFPAYPNSVFPIAGAWGEWTSWGACSVTCGPGKRQRFRFCDSPPPRHGGEFCHGGHVEWSPCIKHCQDMLPRTPLNSPVLDSSCPCGCNKAGAKEGRIIATGRCQGLSVWTLRVDSGQEMTLHFDYFHLNFSQQWVKIRDGESPKDRLLFSSSDPGYPVEVLTTGSVARVEFMTSPLISVSPTAPGAYSNFPVKATLPIHINGFIVSYHSTASPTTTAGPLLFRYREKPAMHSGVTIAGIAICGAAVVVAVVFVIVQRCTAKGRRAKYAMAASASADSPAQGGEDKQGGKTGTNDSPAHRPHSSAQSSSPSSQGNAIHVDMEVPLTGKMRRKASGRDSAISGERPERENTARDTSGHRSRKKKTRLKVNIEMNPAVIPTSNNERVSPTKTKVNAGTNNSKQDHAEMKSPHRLEIIDIDEAGNPCSPTKVRYTASSSPSSKQHRPHNRHRHPKDRQNRTEPPSTKFDLLRKLRQANRSESTSGSADKNDVSGSSRSKTPAQLPSDFERDVTGSSGSSVSTTKAEVNWPRDTSADKDGFGGIGAAHLVRAALSEVVGRTFGPSNAYDRHKRSAATGLGHQQHPHRRPPSEEIPLMDSMTSSLDSPSHFNAMVKSESQDSATTSFVNRDGLPPARRPTSLTASYNSNVSNEEKSPPLETHHKPKPLIGLSAAEKVSTVIPRPAKPSPSALTPTQSSIPPPPSASAIKSLSSEPRSNLTKKVLPQLRPYPFTTSSKPSSKLQHQPQAKPLGSHPSATTPQTPTPTQPSFDERLSSLPKPDGQSPRPYKRESPGPSTPSELSKTLTRSSNLSGSSTDAKGKVSDSVPSNSINLTPISINTSNPVSSTGGLSKAGGQTPGAVSSPKNLSIPSHLRDRISPEKADDSSPIGLSPNRTVAKGTPNSQGPPSPGKLSRTSSKASRSNLSSSMASPARSLPSEVEGLELEYDDFIEDDPLSYFDYEETQKLTFRGIERIGKAPVEEEEDEDEPGEASKVKL
ncbi:thrombospondin-1 [Plakobranchus ocellatus]|uniref:Thrombospondin-1 n=1 Tax=Plakobranchus ocellatus TaxID=259542 RepID=A0AAV4CHY7_9GAST|nr:thrombospondin-1 [Plakobranchus ocellatus]